MTTTNKNVILNEKDIDMLRRKGITEARVTEQLEMFRKGATWAKLVRAATVGDGIVRFDDEERESLVSTYEHKMKNYYVIKFVPASGAASRMFKNLLQFHGQGDIREQDIRERAASGDKDAEQLSEVLESIKQKKFAFYNDLKEVMAADGLDMEQLMEQGDFTAIIDYILNDKGLKYASRPKALIQFHDYGDSTRTALEEHWVEGKSYSLAKTGGVKLHFTISHEHRGGFLSLIDRKIRGYEEPGLVFSMEITEQKSSTNTLAVDEDNNLVRDEEGNLVLRPGGHGALIRNLDEMDWDIVFIKNIDNVVPDRLKEETVRYKKMLGGYLIRLMEQTFMFIRQLTSGNITSGEMEIIADFSRESLNLDLPPDFADMDTEAKKQLLMERLNRPIRVCGMVKNEGEPGGGPFWVEDEDGRVSLQIVEGAQVDKSSPEQLDIMRHATHFNPVDLVCGITDYKREKFKLMDFVDNNAFFISHKSHNGRPLKALELPGLWNGAMAKWTTVFVEVPIITFNPIKTVNDLLRKEHQNIQPINAL